ncbi:MAG: SsrA-binding protein SmpB [Candidatus Eremiobacteraeota bacterium]|nr:SsrA-binding protein SmpB [Candidatus Eremiobacteraeota bacterium]MBV8331546.1 SsrA-binding protein SmpB [Candidatus Eremiobacteraeota bacterium]MBV8720927.1 SsrA-binding protein SmpB [Candidatus Eremiobacteraeota bacterium]
MKSKQQRVTASEEARKHNAPTIDNRRARHEYHILDSLEAGLVLTGTEVKSIRAGGASLNEAYARFRDGEAWLLGMHVPPYKQGSFSNADPNRPRKLLLHKEQIAELQGRVSEKGLTIVPLRLYFTRGMAKVQLGLARGKKFWDKRADTAKRDVEREIARHVRR